MRIAIDLQGAQAGSSIRGIGRYTLSMSKAIIEHVGDKHEVIIVLNGLFPETIGPLKKEFSELLPDCNIKIWYAPGSVSYDLPENNSRRKAAEYIREAFFLSLNPDIIWIPSIFEGFYDNAVISTGAFNSNVPVAVTIHDLIPLVFPNIYLGNESVREYYFEKTEYIKRAHGWLAVSNYTAMEAVNILKLDESNVAVTDEGFDAAFKKISVEKDKKSAFKKRFGIKKDFLLHVGIVADYRKNIDTLLKAYSLLNQEIRQNYQLVLAGGNPDFLINWIITAAGKIGISKEELVFTGYISDEELAVLYNICSLSISPSLYEGFGLSVLEAMACGTPIICANATSLPEVIGNGDAMFNPSDVGDICNKITKALTENNFREELSRRGLEQAKKFSWKKSAKKAVKALECFSKKDPEVFQSDEPIESCIESKEILINNLISKIGSINGKDFQNEELIELTVSIVKSFY